ncbi:MAG: hypothetical protein JOZ90_06120 [Alphaproteobacteria bacterium]|nr:hypothetical protein [Alphaproteobacteria bacterium]MBV9372720.1 hypothetical protein [Alphaproteobacteria bacterium]MBV9900655.1 hypothetical protein [Alphaproteobacteria bacterium]
MNKLAFAMTASALIGSIPAAAQVDPPCCSVETSTTTLSGTVGSSGSSFSTDMSGDSRTIALYTTPQQAAEVPRKVDLRAYRGKRVAVVCQLWHGSGDAWGCEEIGTLSPTKGIRARR